jgi:hypothetical protein
MDRRIGDAFACGGAAEPISGPPDLAETVLETIPLVYARSPLSFSSRSVSSNQTAKQEEQTARGPE